MLFESKSFFSIGIQDGISASVSWDDPSGEEPTQSITMTTDRDFFPPDHVTCFPVEPTASPAPTTAAPTTAAPSLSPTTASVDLLGLAAIAIGIKGALVGLGLLFLELLGEGGGDCSSDDGRGGRSRRSRGSSGSKDDSSDDGGGFIDGLSNLFGDC